MSTPLHHRLARRAATLTGVAAAVAGLFAAGYAQAQGAAYQTALPMQNGRLSFGSATVTVTPDGRTMNVGLNSRRAVINWASFDTAPDHTVRFTGAAGSAALNVVNTGGALNSATRFYGTLESQGPAIYIVNRAGVWFMKESVVRTSSHLVLSDAELPQTSFIQGRPLALPSDAYASADSLGVSMRGTMNVGGHLVATGATVTARGSIDVAGSVAFYSGTRAELNLDDAAPLTLTTREGGRIGEGVGFGGGSFVENQAQLRAGGSVLMAGSIVQHRHSAGGPIDPLDPRTTAIFANQAGGQNGSVTLIADEYVRSNASVTVAGPGSTVRMEAVRDGPSEYVTGGGAVYVTGDVKAEGRIDLTARDLVYVGTAITWPTPTLQAPLVRLGQAHRYGAADDGSEEFKSFTASQTGLPGMQPTRFVDTSTGVNVQAQALTAVASSGVKVNVSGTIANLATMSRMDVSLDGDWRGSNLLLATENLHSAPPEQLNVSWLVATPAGSEQPYMFKFPSELPSAKLGDWMRKLTTIQLEAANEMALTGVLPTLSKGDQLLDLRLRAGNRMQLGTQMRAESPLRLDALVGAGATNTSQSGGLRLVDARTLAVGVLANASRLSSVNLAVNGPGLVQLPSGNMVIGGNGVSDGLQSLTVAVPQGSYQLNGDLNGIRNIKLDGRLEVAKDSIVRAFGDLDWTLPTGQVVSGFYGRYFEMYSGGSRGEQIRRYVGNVGDSNFLITLDGLRGDHQYGDVTAANVGSKLLRISGEGVPPHRATELAPEGLVEGARIPTFGGRYGVGDYTSDSLTLNLSTLNRDTIPLGYVYALDLKSTPFSIKPRPVDVSGAGVTTVFGDAQQLPDVKSLFYATDGISMPWVMTNSAGRAVEPSPLLGAGTYTLVPGPLSSTSSNSSERDAWRNYKPVGSRTLTVDPRPLAVQGNTSSGTYQGDADQFRLLYDARIASQPDYRPDVSVTYGAVAADGKRYGSLAEAPAGPLRLELRTVGADAANYRPTPFVNYELLPFTLWISAPNSFGYGYTGAVCNKDQCSMQPLSGPTWKTEGMHESKLAYLRDWFYPTLWAVDANGNRNPVDDKLPAGRYWLEQEVMGPLAGNIRLKPLRNNLLTVTPYLLALDIDRNLYYGAQNAIVEGGFARMVPSTRAPVRLAEGTLPAYEADESPINIALDVTFKDASGNAQRYAPNLRAGSYTLVPQLTGSGASNYGFFEYDPKFEIRKAIVGYRIDGGLGQYIQGVGFVGAPGGQAELNGVLKGDTVGLLTAVWPGSDTASKAGEPLLNLAQAKPGDYHFQALGLYADANNYVLAEPGGAWSRGASLTVQPSSLVQPALLGLPPAPAPVTAPAPPPVAAPGPAPGPAPSSTSAGNSGTSTQTATSAETTAIGARADASASASKELASGKVGNTDVKLAATTGGSAEAKVGPLGAKASAELGAGVALTLTSGPLTTEVNADMMLLGVAKVGATGAEATAAAGLQAFVADSVKGALGGGVDGAASAKVQAFAGAQGTAKVGLEDGKLQGKTESKVGVGSSATVSGEVGGAAGGVGANTTVYTPGALAINAGGSLGYQDGKVAVNLSLGGALGIGGLSLDITVKFDVATVAAGLTTAWNTLQSLNAPQGPGTPRADGMRRDADRYLRNLDPLGNPQAYIAAMNEWAKYDPVVKSAIAGEHPNSVFSNALSASDSNQSRNLYWSLMSSYRAAQNFGPAFAEANQVRSQQAELVNKIRSKPQSVTMADIQALMASETRANALLKTMNDAAKQVARTMRVDGSGRIVVGG